MELLDELLDDGVFEELLEDDISVLNEDGVLELIDETSVLNEEGVRELIDDDDELIEIDDVVWKVRELND